MRLYSVGIGIYAQSTASITTTLIAVVPGTDIVAALVITVITPVTPVISGIGQRAVAIAVDIFALSFVPAQVATSIAMCHCFNRCF